ncbi:putative membrane protein [Motilibacter peucedani]|uniref:Putative membrane protein n=1 Tax=Motilibacter peucedani TaxID=598650 RepID=A0A420XM88_9ACTN|nr:DUF1003 domain-containing protein [Motilibacter peucedani]RKS72476.1 putative membrane protein [Motilibacter peucedani]
MARDERGLRGPRPSRSRPALDVPRERGRRGLRGPGYDAETFGAIGERIARFLGTWRFIGYLTVFVALWLAWNTWTPDRLQFDPRATNYTLLTLILSLQASYAAPLILLAQNRQADRDRVQWEQDRARSERSIADTEYLTRELAAVRIALGEVATRDFLRGELRTLLEELEERQAEQPPAAEYES